MNAVSETPSARAWLELIATQTENPAPQKEGAFFLGNTQQQRASDNKKSHIP